MCVETNKAPVVGGSENNQSRRGTLLTAVNSHPTLLALSTPLTAVNKTPTFWALSTNYIAASPLL